MRRSIGMMAAAVAAMGAVSGIAVAGEPMERVAPAPRKRAPKPIAISAPRRETRLNRSRHWDYAETYQDARLISPFPQRVVR